MKFRGLNENMSSDDLYKQVVDYLYDNFYDTLDNIAISMASEFSWYDPEFSIENDGTGTDKYSDQGSKLLYNAAEYFAMALMANAPDEIPVDNFNYQRRWESLKEQLEADDEDGWGEQIEDALYDTFEDIESVMYEVRNCRRGSYAGFGDKVDDLIDKLREIATQLENDASYIEDQNAGQELQEGRSLTEKEWSHNLSVGKALRDAIDNEDYEQLKALLKQAYTEIAEVAPDFFDEDDLENKVEELDMYDIEPDEYTDEEELEDTWNYELNDLYDLCDVANIWIPLE